MSREIAVPLPRRYDTQSCKTIYPMAHLPFMYPPRFGDTKSSGDAMALQSGINQFWYHQVLNEYFKNFPQEQKQQESQMEPQENNSKFHSLALIGREKQNSTGNFFGFDLNVNAAKGDKNLPQKPAKKSRISYSTQSATVDFTSYSKTMESKAYTTNIDDEQEEPLDLSKKHKQSYDKSSKKPVEIHKTRPLDLSLPKLSKPDTKISTSATFVKGPRPKPIKKTFQKWSNRVVVSRLRHLEALASVFLARQKEGFARDKLSECSCCGSCSFAVSPSDVMKWMRLHLYSHAPGLFKCRLCHECEGFSAAMIKAHLLQKHGADSATRANVYDRRGEMDEQLISLVKKCYPKCKD